MNTKKYTIGVDVGGSHISCVAIDMESLEICKSTFKREHLSHTDTVENILTTWAKAINECVEQVGIDNVTGIGFAIPGPFNYREGISLMEHKYPQLYKVHIPTQLQKYLKHSLPMRFLNDASSFAVGVSWIGKGKGFDKVVVITLGTGFGSAYIQKGVPIVEGDTVAPEGCFWHLPFKDGIADEYFSTRWFVNSYKNLTGEDVKGVKEIIDTPHKEKLFNEFGFNLGEFVAPWLKKFQADILVMGGNISLAYPHFEESFLKVLADKQCDVKIAVSTLMEDAAMVGAARLFDEDFWKEVSKNLPSI